MASKKKISGEGKAPVLAASTPAGGVKERWQDSPGFNAWLAETGYTMCSEGLKLYMWEAWCDGFRHARRTGSA